MKLLNLFVMSTVLSSSIAFADTLSCVLSNATRPTQKSVVRVDLLKPIQEYYTERNGVNIDDRNYSFGLQIEKSKEAVEVSVLLYENKHVQDEVGGFSFTVDLKKAQQSKSKQPWRVLKEPLENEGKVEMYLECFYSK